MKYIRIIYKVAGLKILLVAGLVLMATTARKNTAVTQKQKNIRHWWLKKVIQIVGIQLTTKGQVPQKSETALWVSNHISWLDIPVIGSEDVTFLSKAEIRKWPVLGWLTKKSGTLYIQRGGKNASQTASQNIADTITSGTDRVIVFPEATTTDGKDVKCFHARIFAPAIDHSLSVQPICIRYLDKKGNSHPKMIWGDESFMSNLFAILGEAHIQVELNFLEPIDGGKYSERKELANQARENIRECLLDVTER